MGKEKKVQVTELGVGFRCRFGGRGGGPSSRRVGSSFGSARGRRGVEKDREELSMAKRRDRVFIVTR
jgi:hypothetical protein